VTGESLAETVEQSDGGSASQRVDRERQRGKVAGAGHQRQAGHQQRVEWRGRAQHALAGVVDKAPTGDEITGVAEGDVSVVYHPLAGYQAGQQRQSQQAHNQ